MARKPTASDARLGLQLYDLRREAEMRKARNFVNMTFNPKTADEFLTVAQNYSSQESTHLSQVLSYWQIAASLVLHGTLHPAVFADVCGEGLYVFAKFKPLLKQIRAKYDPEFLSKLEKVVQQNKVVRERVADIEKRMAQWAERHKAQEAAAAD
ncbi:MAG: hypothetical protein L0212_09575 [Acidobacteria bacterium]|nr:hypothetical protein [Acidobacteriota bacterium]